MPDWPVRRRLALSYTGPNYDVLGRGRPHQMADTEISGLNRGPFTRSHVGIY